MTDEIRTILLELSKSHSNPPIEEPIWERMSTQVTCLLHCVSASLTSLCFLVAFRHRWKEPVFSCIQCFPVLNSCVGEALPHYSVLKDKNTDLGKWINNIYWSGKGRTQISSSSGLVSSLVYCSKLALLLASTIQNPRGKSCCSFNPRKNGFTAESVLCPSPMSISATNINSNVQN